MIIPITATVVGATGVALLLHQNKKKGKEKLIRYLETPEEYNKLTGSLAATTYGKEVDVFKHLIVLNELHIQLKKVQQNPSSDLLVKILHTFFEYTPSFYTPNAIYSVTCLMNSHFYLTIKNPNSKKTFDYPIKVEKLRYILPYTKELERLADITLNYVIPAPAVLENEVILNEIQTILLQLRNACEKVEKPLEPEVLAQLEIDCIIALREPITSDPIILAKTEENSVQDNVDGFKDTCGPDLYNDSIHILNYPFKKNDRGVK